MKGYTGRIAHVDLTGQKATVTELSEETARAYLGGKGIGAYFLYKELKPGTDPYSSDNMIIFVSGPLNGTSFPCSGRAAAVTKSPMTGTFLDSYAGGSFGPCLKHAGYDALAITGRAKSLSYIRVDNDQISIEDAGPIRGLNTVDSEVWLRGRLKRGAKEMMSVATIGQSGEYLVRFANIATEGRMFGRGGAGAVMGSKNLKAVVLKGSRKVDAADPEGLKELVSHVKKKIAVHPMTGRGGVFPREGTMMTLALTQETGTLPTKNWSENTFDGAFHIDGNAFLNFKRQSRACYMCPIGCSRITKTTAFGDVCTNEGPEYETIYAFGPNCGIRNPAIINAADRICEEYGMDTITCGAVIGFAMECFEKELITKEETGGIELRFGNEEAVLSMVRLIGKKEGIGALLAEGVRRASEKIEGSSGLAVHVKGLELPGYDPRGMKGQGLTYALADRGACHVRSNTIRTELLGLPQKVDRLSYEGKAMMVSELQLTYVIFDALISCAFGGFAITQEDYVKAICAITGWAMSMEELRTIAQRIWTLTRLFNAREGFTRKDDTLPGRLFNTRATGGPSGGQIVERKAFEKMLDEYYAIVGWDVATGIPTKKRLKELDIEK